MFSEFVLPFLEKEPIHQNRPVLINVWILAVLDLFEPSKEEYLNYFTNNKGLKNFFLVYNRNKFILYTRKKFFNPLLLVKLFIIFHPLGSNKSKTARIQTLINTGLFWCIGFFSKNGKTNSENNDYIRHNSTIISTYALSLELCIPPIAGICAAL